jgi:hypothetical protein
MNDLSNKVVGCSAVNDHISKPIPKTLWHYTSYAAFQGIITSKKIWATEYRFLNDRQEFLHAKELAQKLVDEEPEFMGESFPARDTLRAGVNVAFNTGHLHEERLRIMVASFSEEGDQLSQWRGYAGESTGVSVGFDLRGIRPPLDVETTVTFAPCVYEESDKRALLKAVLAQYQAQLQKWWDSTASLTRKKHFESGGTYPQFPHEIDPKGVREVIGRCQTILQFDLLRVAPLLKDKSFSEEKEWRLVLPVEAIRIPTNQTIEFRPTRNALVPYIAYPLNVPNQEGSIFCNDLILGPGNHPSAEVGVNMFLQKNQIMILSRPSKVPYRPK